MALELADVAGFEKRRARVAQARQAARARHLQHHRARRRRRLRGRGDPLRPLRHASRCSPAAITQGQGHETVVQADRLRPARRRSRRGHLYPGRHRQGVLRRGHRRLALGDARRLGVPRRGGQDHRQGQADRRACARRSMSPTSSSTEGMFSSPKTNRTLTIEDVARAAADPTKLPKGMEAGLIATAVYNGGRRELSQRLPCLRGRDRPGDRRGRHRALQRRRRRRHRDQSAAAARPDPRRRRAGHRPDPDGGHPLRRRSGQLAHRLVHGLRDAARRRHQRVDGRESIRCRRRPIRSASKARRGRLRRRACRRSPTRSSTRCRSSASATSRCRRRRSGCGARSRRSATR